ncbi:MAG TPA: FlgD immunoglobulin-like domain containing protein [Thermoleophilia bacterium]|nr:FlgD immunoglobulin-like domain containing protein [Thermoleophilia bacterium]
MAARRVPLVAILVLLAGLVIVPVAGAATAVKASVRVEAAPYEVAPATTVRVSPTAVLTDSEGNVYKPGHASALGALAAGATLRGFGWEAAYGGDFVVNIGGFASLADFSNGWIYAVNGAGYPVVDVGAMSFKLRAGDRVVFAQYPDGTFTRSTKLLVVALEKRAYLPGEAVTMTVLGDDLTKVNSAADALRFKQVDGSGNPDPNKIETPDQFAPVADATLHVGTATYTTDAEGEVSFPATATPPYPLGNGGHAVWAEKAMDDTWTYVRSPRSLINVGPAPELSDVSANASFTRGVGRLTVHYTLSKAAMVRLVAKNGAGKVVYSSSKARTAGAGTTVWSGRNNTGAWVAAGTYDCTLSAKDAWGRTSASVPLTVKVK